MLLRASCVRSLLYRHGFGYMWEADTIENGVHFIHMFKLRIKDCFMQELQSEIENCSKALQNKHFKTSFETSDYLHADFPYMYNQKRYDTMCHIIPFDSIIKKMLLQLLFYRAEKMF